MRPGIRSNLADLLSAKKYRDYPVTPGSVRFIIPVAINRYVEAKPNVYREFAGLVMHGIFIQGDYIEFVWFGKRLMYLTPDKIVVKTDYQVRLQSYPIKSIHFTYRSCSINLREDGNTEVFVGAKASPRTYHPLPELPDHVLDLVPVLVGLLNLLPSYARP